ncbi:hypothetical protein AYI69_g11460 [Smittium culicis]|uniref:Uncharacterized protein n=1 Tax=Smittium culicis TaxID=133412 RepID=A0A1R1WYL0_9FUNG|nr:hypothetical protein AYI69_g11460 [Smittium culicis]
MAVDRIEQESNVKKNSENGQNGPRIGGCARSSKLWDQVGFMESNQGPCGGLLNSQKTYYSAFFYDSNSA